MENNSIIKVTRKIGEWLGVDLGYYIRNNLYLLTAQVIILLCGLASSIVLARLLPKESYGQYNYIFSIIGILTISSLPGMNAAIANAVANQNDRVLITGTKTKLKWSLIGAVVCLFVGFYYYSSGESLLAKCFIGASLLFPLYASLNTFYPFLDGRRLFNLSARYRSGYWIFLTMAVILAVYLTKNLLWVVIAYLVTATILESGFLFNTIKRSKLSRGEDSTAITYGKQLTGIQAMGLAALQFDRLRLVPPSSLKSQPWTKASPTLK